MNAKIRIATPGKLNIPQNIIASLNLHDGDFVDVEIKKLKFVEVDANAEN